MKINEIGGERNSEFGAPPNTQRRLEVERLSQSLAAERQASSQACQMPPNSRPVVSVGDSSEFSTEAVNAMQAGQPAPRTGSLIAALKASMDNVGDDPSRYKPGRQAEIIETYRR